MYRFAGFFAKPLIDRPARLPEEAVWRTISVPFEGIGVRLPALIGESPSPSEVNRLLQEVGLHAAMDWLYITYDCWAGRIDSVYGLGVRSGQFFGPVKESDISQVKAVYLALMREFGVQPDDALRFPPFVRGFWGETYFSRGTGG
jgi:hypothetical protein